MGIYTLQIKTPDCSPHLCEGGKQSSVKTTQKCILAFLSSIFSCYDYLIIILYLCQTSHTDTLANTLVLFLNLQH